jgi:hypothetical protein
MSFSRERQRRERIYPRGVMTATVLYRGLISGYPAQGRRLSGEEIDNALLVEGYCSKFCSSPLVGFRITRRKSRQFT